METASVESVKFDEISKEVNRVMPKTIYEKLSLIQLELKAPKSQFNRFGNYYYRSCEDILEAVKPLCNKNEVTLMIGDEIVCIEGRHYVKALEELAARFHDDEDFSARCNKIISQLR